MEKIKKIIILSTMIFLLLPALIVGQVVEMSIKEMTEVSTSIHLAKCIEKQSFWTEKKDRIYTKITFTVEETVKGETVQQTEVLLPGGRMGDVIYEVSDMPIFIEGEDALVFLWQHPAGHNLVTGAIQGKLSVLQDKESGERLIKISKPIDHESDDHEHEQKVTTKSVRAYIDEIKGYLKE